MLTPLFTTNGNGIPELGSGVLGLGQLRGLPGQLLSLLLFFFLLLGRCEALSISQVVHSNGQEHIQ